MGTIEKALKRQQQSSQAISANETDVDDNDLKKSSSVHNNVAVEPVAKNKTVSSTIELAEFDQAEGLTENNYSQTVEVDLERLKDSGFITSLDSRSRLSEEFREIKRPLLQNIKGRGAQQIERANLIQITSSVQGEGKTFASINLAMAFAMELDYRVLLVDADVIKSSISKTLGIQSDYGLTDYLQGKVTKLSEVLLKTNIPKLSVLPAGSEHNLSAELLNSEFMDNLIHELSVRYKDRVVIIDSPPLLETNESRILAQKTGQIVFVVEHNKTPQATIKNALSLLDPEMVIGLVLNKNRSGANNSYYYGYGADAE